MRPAAPERRRRVAVLLTLALALAAPLAAFAQADHDHPSPDNSAADNDPRVRDIASQLTCYCGCNTQSIADCTCGIAQKERRAIHDQLNDGETPEAIVAGWVERHGSSILIEPPRSGFNLLGWFLPGAALVVAAIFLAFRVRSWSRQAAPAAAAAPAPGAPAALDPAYREKLREELERRRG